MKIFTFDRLQQAKHVWASCYCYYVQITIKFAPRQKIFRNSVVASIELIISVSSKFGILRYLRGNAHRLIDIYK